MAHQRLLAALYPRVSTDEQVKGFSLEAQQSLLLDYCRNADIGVYKIYVEAGRSGKDIEGRPALRELLEDARQGRFQQVVCLRLNRISRNLTDLLHIVELLDQNGITLHSLTEDLRTDTPMGKFSLQMIGAVAENERRQIAQNVRLSMQRRGRLGKWNGGNQVLGYRWITDLTDRQRSFTEIVPEEAALVRFIFEWYASGLGLKAIATRLNSGGHHTKRGKAFHSVSVRCLLTNVNYIGKIAYHDDQGIRTVTDGEHEPIVSLELWEKVQNQLDERSCPPTKLTSRYYPLVGLLKCPICSGSMIPSHVTRYRKDGTRKVTHYYICSRYNSGGSTVCKPNHIQADSIETWVNDRVLHFLSHPSVAEQLVEEINHRRDKKLLPIWQRMKGIDGQLASLKSRSLRCYEMFEDGHIDSSELRIRLDEIRAEAALLEKERGQLEQSVAASPERSIPVASVRQALGNFRPMLQRASPEQQKKLFRSLIDRIAVPPNRDISKAIIRGTATLLGLEIPTIVERGNTQA